MKIIKKLAARGGLTLTQSDEEFLLKKDDEGIKQNKERSTQLFFALLAGFVRCAIDGEVFESEDKIKQDFGCTLKENYPEANDLFLNFAKTYWTFKIALDNILSSSEQWAGMGFLSELEIKIASIFFPTLGPLQIPYQKREKAQRAILEEYGAKINIDEFIAGNPILIREKSRPRGFFDKLFGR